VVEIPFNDPDGAEAILERERSDLAAVLIETVVTTAGMIPATPAFLERMRAVTERGAPVLSPCVGAPDGHRAPAR
jgi:glutamate-1-semialdehyde 2,1-aminomutase